MLKSLYKIAGFPAVEIWKSAPTGRPEKGNSHPAKSLTDCAADPVPRPTVASRVSAEPQLRLQGGARPLPGARPARELPEGRPGAASPALPSTRRSPLRPSASARRGCQTGHIPPLAAGGSIGGWGGKNVWYTKPINLGHGSLVWFKIKPKGKDVSAAGTQEACGTPDVAWRVSVPYSPHAPPPTPGRAGRRRLSRCWGVKGGPASRITAKSDPHPSLPRFHVSGAGVPAPSPRYPHGREAPGRGRAGGWGPRWLALPSPSINNFHSIQKSSFLSALNAVLIPPPGDGIPVCFPLFNAVAGTTVAARQGVGSSGGEGSGPRPARPRVRGGSCGHRAAPELRPAAAAPARPSRLPGLRLPLEDIVSPAAPTPAVPGAQKDPLPPVSLARTCCGSLVVSPAVGPLHWTWHFRRRRLGHHTWSLWPISTFRHTAFVSGPPHVGHGGPSPGGASLQLLGRGAPLLRGGARGGELSRAGPGAVRGSEPAGPECSPLSFPPGEVTTPLVHVVWLDSGACHTSGISP
ncbi:uncharacterized protein WM277_018582 [Molossus nigricans]